MDNEPKLRDIFDFDDSDLKANHQGRISARQRQRLAWRRFFPRLWYLDLITTFAFLFLIPLFILLIIANSISLQSRFIGIIGLGSIIYSLVNRPTTRAFFNRGRDLQAERADCLYGRVLHLPNNHVLVGARKIGPLSTAEQQAFEHNTYYMIYIAPHSGDILAAEIAEKPKYDEN